LHTETDMELVILADQAPHPSIDLNKKINVEPARSRKKRYDYLLKERSEPRGRRVILMNHQALPPYERYRRVPKTPPSPFAFVVVDEAHLLKESGSQTAEAVYGARSGKDIAIEGRWKILASGTFIENGGKDLLGALKYLARGEVGAAATMLVKLSIAQLERLL